MWRYCVQANGYSSHTPNPLSILIIFCRNNRDCFPYLSESRTTTAARSTHITRAGGRLPCRPTNSCGYRQGEPSPYLVSRFLRRAQLSYYRASHGHEQGPDPRWYPSVLSFRYNPCAGTVGSPDSLLQGHPSVQVPTNKCNQEESLSMVHLRWFDRDTSGMN